MAAVVSSARPTAVPLPPHLKRAANSKPAASSSSKTSSKANNGTPTPAYKVQTSSNALPLRRKRKQETPMKQFTRWLVNNQTGRSWDGEQNNTPPPPY